MNGPERARTRRGTRRGPRRGAVAAALVAALTTWTVAGPLPRVASGDCAQHENIPAHMDADGSAYLCGCGTGLVGIDWKTTSVPCQKYHFKYPAHTRCLDETWNVSDCEPGKPKKVVQVFYKCKCECVGGDVQVGGFNVCLGYWQAHCTKKKGKLNAGTIATDVEVPC